MSFKIRPAALAACTVVALVAATPAAFAQPASMPAAAPMAPSAVGMADKSFVMNAAVGGMTEVEVSKIALSKAGSQPAKDYAQKMIDDHTKANDALKAIATPKGLTPPAAPDAMHQKVIDKFAAMPAGAAFDAAYQKQMVGDHQKTVALFQKEAKGGKDADLKGFAAKTLPDLQGHLKMAQGMKSMKTM